MIRRPPISTRTDTPCPYTALCRSGAQVATLDCRPAKPEIVDEDILREGWRRRAAEVGFSGNVPTGPHHSVVASDDQLGTLLTEQDATFDRRQVIRAVAETATQGLDYDAIRHRADRYLASDAVVEVARGCWPTPEMLALEADAPRRPVAGPRTVPVDPRSWKLAVRPRPSQSQTRRVGRDRDMTGIT